ncbi:topoisomerase DNA-binding C4 zinc finger domain-containing protein, partial [Candidatus Bipolaricaulota bacterium]|nr:topoisomerase DNA-binding C4 zinc finger domain-containing protein [Candidatus Bipolaricaulota bacterium]
MTDVVCDKCKLPMELRYWKGSHFVGCSNYPDCRNTRSLPAELPYRYKDGVLIIAESLEKTEKEMETKVTCSVCGAPMATRNGRYGRYLKCSNSECNATTSIPTGVSCPSCEKGMLVERYSQKRKQTFYGCNNYPSCRYAMSEQPVEACPACGHGVLVEKKGKVVCNNKECSYSKEIE